MEDGELNNLLGLSLAGYVNGVAQRHGEVSREMFPDYEIDAITNGVPRGWASAPWRPCSTTSAGWRRENGRLRFVESVDGGAARGASRGEAAARGRGAPTHGKVLSAEVFTIGFARQTPYKRALLLLSDIQRLAALAGRHGGLQIVYAGKAPRGTRRDRAWSRTFPRSGARCPTP